MASIMSHSNSGGVFRNKKSEVCDGSKSNDNRNPGSFTPACDFCCLEMLVAIFKLSKHLKSVHYARISVTCTLCGENFECNREFEEHLILHNSMTEERSPKKVIERTEISNRTDRNHAVKHTDGIKNKRGKSNEVSSNLGLATEDNLSDFDSGKLRNEHGNETTSIVEEVQQSGLEYWDNDFDVSPLTPEFDPLDVSVVDIEFVKTESHGISEIENNRSIEFVKDGDFSPGKRARKEDDQSFTEEFYVGMSFANIQDPESLETQIGKNNFSYRCNECNLTFGSVGMLQIHSSYHTLKVNGHFECLVCSKYLRTLQEYESHQEASSCGNYSENLETLASEPSTEIYPNLKKACVCDECEQNFETLKDYESHKLLKHNVSPYKCMQCQKILSSWRSLHRHIQTFHDANWEGLKCSKGPKTFSAPTQLIAHLPFSPKKIACTCDTCGKKFGSLRSLQRHETEHLGKKPLKCTNCNRSFARQRSLQQHLKYKCKNVDKSDPTVSAPSTVPPSLSCQFCDFIASASGLIGDHIKRVHFRHGTFDENDKLNQEKKYFCDICGDGFVREISLVQHRIYHDEANKTVKCKYSDCKETFFTIHERFYHIRTTHEKFKCEFCGMEFLYSHSLKNHRMCIHTKEKPYKCTYCDKRFSVKAELTHHTITHTGDYKHSCDVCGRKFITNYKLRQHKLFHEGYPCRKCGFKCGTWRALRKHKCGAVNMAQTSEKPMKENRRRASTIVKRNEYPCQFCDFKSTTSTLVSDHVKRVHFRNGPFDENDKLNQEKKHFCDICGEGFVRDASLQQHQIYHVESNKNITCKFADCQETFFTVYERFYHIRTTHDKFTCEFCGKEFLYAHSLVSHRRYIHTKETPYECTYCDKKFKVKADLTHHIVVHTGDYKFSCDICGKKCVTKARLRNHLLTHEGYPCRKCWFKCGSNKALLKHKCEVRKVSQLREKALKEELDELDEASDE